jgi:hypothetical protein
LSCRFLSSSCLSRRNSPTPSPPFIPRHCPIQTTTSSQFAAPILP